MLDTLVAKYRGEVERLQRECAQAEDQVVHLRDQLQVRIRQTKFRRAQAAATTASCSRQRVSHQLASLSHSPAVPLLVLGIKHCML